MTKEEEAITRLKYLLFIYREDDSNEFKLTGELFRNDLEAIETVLNMLKEKDKEIDLMAEEINETNRSYNDYCKMKKECDKNCKNCIKQYFERKSKEWKKI